MKAFILVLFICLGLPNFTFALDTTYTLTDTRGDFNELLGVNAGPVPNGESTVDLTSSYQEYGVKLIRTHDFYGPLDMSVMYPDKTRSPSLQSSFNFTTAAANSFSSDYVFSSIINGGFEPYFRIGDSWNNASPPRNETERNNLATATVNVLRHYRQGLWNGFNSNFRFVEIWNEPNHRQFWPNPYTENDFFLLYRAISSSIRSTFPELKIGGPGFAPSGYLTNEGKGMVTRFLDYVRANNLPLDFLSYHVYTDNPDEYTTAYNFYRQELDTRGFNNVDLHITEYNAETDTNRVDAKGASINTSAWILMQRQGIKVATFYRGNDTSMALPTFYGMFFADGRPKKNALAFKLWSEITNLGKILNYNQTGTITGLYFLGATDAFGNIGALIANTSADTKTYKVDHQNRNLIYLAKTLKTINDTSQSIITSSPTSLEISIPPYSVQYLELKSYFSDVIPLNNYHDYISAIYRNGITIGCSQSPLNFCPSQKVTREQMSAFIIRAKEGEPPTNYCGTTSPFNDVPVTHNYCRYIKRMLELSITVGCGGGNYCPSEEVTREQMAAFIIRAKEGEPPTNYCGTTSPFNDVPATDYYCGYIKRMLELGITVGCGGGNYCPSEKVTREQMAAFIARAFLNMQATNTPSLTLVSRNTITPTSTDSIGVFTRIFYNSVNDKIYVLYAGRPVDSSDPQGVVKYFRWRQYDTNFNNTGLEGTLQGFTSAGDYAMVQVDNNYYHLTNHGSTTTGVLSYKLTKFDGNMNDIASTTIQLCPHDSNIDQMMNYNNNKLIIGAMHEDNYSPPTTPPKPDYTPHIHIYTYNLDLTPGGTNKVLSQPSNYSWGGSVIWDGSYYNIVTFDSFNSNKLYVYKYNSSWDFVSQKLLSEDSQWSQGLIWDGNYYYVAYHKGEHNHGNVAIGIFNRYWNRINDVQVTNYSNGINAQRPFLLKMGNLLFVSYDLETYNATTGENNKDWQAQVDIYEIYNFNP